MKNWRKSDIGKVIVYRGEKGLDEKIVIYNVNPQTPNTVGFVEYPITLNSEIHPPYLASKIGCVGIIKSQEKESKEYFEKAGDWCSVDRVSKDERGVLETIARTPRDILDII